MTEENEIINAGASGEAEVSDEPVPDGEKELVHLLSEIPSQETETCVCLNPDCALVFNPRTTGWTTSEPDHKGGTFRGKYVSCATSLPDPP